MAVENETAEQVVKMVLQGTEVVLRVSGEAAINVVKMIYTVLKNDRTSKGRATLWEFLKSGKDQKIFQIPDSYLKPFTTASKKYGFPFVVLKDKNSKNGLTDIMVYASDASKVNRVIEYLQLTVKRAETISSEVKVDGATELIKPLGMQLKVPFELIDNIPEYPKDKRMLAELQRYAAKMKTSGPQIVEPIGLLCKENGHYEILPGEGNKRLLSLRLAGYKEAVAEISVPKQSNIEVRSENVDEKPSQERNDSSRQGMEPAPLDKAADEPNKEEGQTVNPTMARTTKDPASGHALGNSLVPTDEITSTVDKRPSVRAELERCRKISEANEALKAVQKATKVVAKPNPISK